MLSHYRRDPSVIEVHGPSSWQRRLGGSSTCGPQYARRVGGVRLCGDRELSLGSSPTDLPSAGPGPSGLNTALGSDGQGQTSFSSVFLIFFDFVRIFIFLFKFGCLFLCHLRSTWCEHACSPLTSSRASLRNASFEILN